MNNIIKIIFLLICMPLYTYADHPHNWQIGLQKSVTPMMDNITELHNILLVLIFSIVIFITSLLIYVCYKFSAKRNPVPAKFSHNVVLEVTWTIIPVIILIIIAIPSFKALYFAERIPKADLTIKVVGYQWYWHYSYPENGNFEYDSYILDKKKVEDKRFNLLEVDNRLVIPVGTTVRFIVTAADVIHSFTVPAFGFKVDAVPGRIHETWANVKETGIYYGQCSEICGVNHGFMPIAVEVVTKEEFDSWLKTAAEKYK